MGPYGVPRSLSMGPYGVPGSRDSWTRGLWSRGLWTRDLGSRGLWTRDLRVPGLMDPGPGAQGGHRDPGRPASRPLMDQKNSIILNEKNGNPKS